MPIEATVILCLVTGICSYLIGRLGYRQMVRNKMNHFPDHLRVVDIRRHF